jgi:hypothetical protein
MVAAAGEVGGSFPASPTAVDGDGDGEHPDESTS